MTSSSATFSGGCQCGAVRYRAERIPSNAHICHCRMCQKAAGNYFMPLGSVTDAQLTITRGEPSWFKSSEIVERGFCPQCGTPLFYKTIGGKTVEIVLGSLDRPDLVKPTWQSDIYAHMPWFDELADLRAPESGDATEEEHSRFQAIRVTNHQHPDHDTKSWPPEDNQ
jgi:hypothetical protein